MKEVKMVGGGTINNDNDNDNDTKVEKIITFLLPNEENRKMCLSLFLEALNKANSFGSNKWGTYYQNDGHGIRLLVGSLIVFTIHKGEIWLALDKHLLNESKATRDLLDNTTNWRWDIGRWSEYIPVPSKNGYYSPSEDSKGIWPYIRDLHFSYIEKVANKYEWLNMRSQRKHSHDLLNYLRMALDKNIPDPNYGDFLDTYPINNKENKFPIQSFSWTIVSTTVFIKEMDKSSFIHHGTGIPKNIRHYFGVDTLQKGESKNIFLLHKEILYNAQIEMDNVESPRTRLFWKSDFVDLNKSELSDWFTYYQNFSENPKEDLPQLRLEKSIEHNNTFLVNFINPTEINLDINAEIDEEQEPISEGAIKYFYGKKYERKPENRRRAIEIHGAICAICKFDFEKEYGERGRGYIEIHHTKPLSSLDNEQIIDPVNDLIPVCSNCHRMIHRRKDSVMSIEEMIQIILSKRLPHA